MKTAAGSIETWIDGYTDGQQRLHGGQTTAPFAERTIIYSGSQALPMDYNNINSPWFSEAERTWDKVAELDVRGREHAGGALPGRAGRVRGNGGGRRHPQGRRHGHLEYGG